ILNGVAKAAGYRKRPCGAVDYNGCVDAPWLDMEDPAGSNLPRRSDSDAVADQVNVPRCSRAWTRVRADESDAGNTDVGSRRITTPRPFQDDVSRLTHDLNPGCDRDARRYAADFPAAYDREDA